MFTFIKKFNTKNGRPNTIVMKLVDDGKSIGPVSAHIKDITKAWMKNKDLVLTNEGEVFNRSANNSASRKPFARDNAERNSLVSINIIPQTGSESQGGKSEKDPEAMGRLRYVNKQARKESARWLQLPGDSTLRARRVLTEKDFSDEQLGHIIPYFHPSSQAERAKKLQVPPRRFHHFL